LKKRLSADLQKRVTKFIHYASRARGINTADSDLDLVAEKKRLRPRRA
jgi:predicted nucleotidyltransferase